MAKGIIVVDVPEHDCRGCQCFGTYNKCGAVQKFVDPIVGKVPDWCPIKPLPEKKLLTGDVSNAAKAGKELVRVGWNACIDEILKECNENVYN